MSWDCFTSGWRTSSWPFVILRVDAGSASCQRTQSLQRGLACHQGPRSDRNRPHHFWGVSGGDSSFVTSLDATVCSISLSRGRDGEGSRSTRVCFYHVHAVVRWRCDIHMSKTLPPPAITAPQNLQTAPKCSKTNQDDPTQPNTTRCTHTSTQSHPHEARKTNPVPPKTQICTF